MSSKITGLKLLAGLFMFIPLIGIAQDVDLVLKGGKIIDGTGNSWFNGDVGVRDGKIVFVGRVFAGSAERVLDVKGLVVAPGFIDVHAHVERTCLEVPTADNFVFDGVTSIITGNCGGSRTDLAKYFSQLDSVRLSINIGTLIGHNSVRDDVMGNSQRDPTPEELKAMEARIAEAMRAGAVGFSTGLIYVPGTYSKTPEVVALAKVAARYNGVYASHVRNEGDDVTEGIEEAINIGREAHIPVEISHFKVTYKPNWGRSANTLAQIERARQEGIDVTVDQYPYIASSTSLNTELPTHIFSGGQDSLLMRLRGAESRRRIKAEMVRMLKKKQMKDFSYAVVARYDADTTLNGKSISEINLIKGRKSKPLEEAETVLEMVENGSAQMVYFKMSDVDLKRIMQYPFNMFASDGGIVRFGEGSPHPRSYGTNARILGHFVREMKVIRLEEAIRRMTSLPAQKFQLHDRGLIRTGMAADLVVFDENTVVDQSTFSKPHAYSSGFAYTIVNGVITLADGKHTRARAGQILKGPGATLQY